MSHVIRIRLSRAKGWRMPPNTLKVDRTTKWGNPCKVGPSMTREESVRIFRLMLGGLICLSGAEGLAEAQMAYNKMANRDIGKLRGKNLACWCPLDAPCHADILMEIANK